MPKRSSKEDLPRVSSISGRSKKNPAAVALGRRGGLKGGRARAEALSPEERSRIAKLAAEARWNNTE